MGIEFEIEGEEYLDPASHERGADEQNQGEGDFDDDESVAETRAGHAHAWAAAGFF